MVIRLDLMMDEVSSMRLVAMEEKFRIGSPLDNKENPSESKENLQGANRPHSSEDKK